MYVHMRKLIQSLLMTGAVMAFTSCATPKNYSYFQDLSTDVSLKVPEVRMSKIGPQDQLTIVVETKNPQLRIAYNKTLVSNFDPDNLMRVEHMIYYIVDEEGNVNFPHVGKIHLGGMSRHEAELHIENLLKSQNLVNDASVTIQIQNHIYNVMGEVNRPGQYSFVKDGYTLIDALCNCGDLTTFALRNNIKVIRNENGEQKTYKVDLTSAKNLLASPAYYIQSGDTIYVEANKTKALQSTTNSSQTFTYSFWISLASTLLTLGVLLVK